MCGLKKKYSYIQSQFVLLSLFLCCLCFNIDGMIPFDNQQCEQFLAGTNIPGQVAQVLRNLCSAVYDGKEGLNRVEGVNDLRMFLPDNAEREGDLSGVVSRLRGTNSLVVTFPGSRTESIGLMVNDWFSNFHVFRPLGDGGFSERFGERECLVHPGYALKVNVYWNNMMSAIREAGAFDEIYFTGHSKGGGVALLSALRYAHENLDLIGQHKIKIVTFCAPPVFWGAQGAQLFYRHFDHSDVASLYKKLDLVPFVPRITRLVHVGTEFPIGILDANFPNPGGALGIGNVLRRMGANGLIAHGVAGLAYLVDLSFNAHSIDQFTTVQIDRNVEV